MYKYCLQNNSFLLTFIHHNPKPSLLLLYPTLQMYKYCLQNNSFLLTFIQSDVI